MHRPRRGARRAQPRASTTTCERHVAGAIETSRRCRVITSVPANDDVISTESPRPSALGRPGPPTINATPPRAIVIASHVRRDTASPSSIPSTAARSGASACMKRMFATDAWFSAIRNEPDEIAINAAIARPPRPIARNARTSAPRSAIAM